MLNMPAPQRKLRKRSDKPPVRLGQFFCLF
nr:MAG TPA: hypothetical protein [Caudoviricetes sp.]